MPHAAIHAERFGSEMVLLMVLGPLPEPTMVMAGRRASRSAEEASARLAQSYLEGIAVGLKEQGIPVETEAVEGKPYLEIIRYAEGNALDLIVVSTRGHSGLSRWLLGSVADRVVRGATVPLLLVQCRDVRDECND